MAIGTTAAIIGAAAIGAGGTALASRSASKASQRASDAQQQSTDAAIFEQRRQFERVQQLLKPWVDAGPPALQEQLNIIGLGGREAQQRAITQQEESPFFRDLARQGEEAILAQGSATGGLRGGNTQGALAQFRPSLLNSFIEQQYNRLGGISAIGQNAAAGVGNAGAGFANNVGGLLQQGGAIQAGNFLAQGQAQQNMIGGFAQGFGSLLQTPGLFGGAGAGGGFQVAPQIAAQNQAFLNNPVRF